MEGAQLYKGEGCHFCSYTGYHGRTGIFEVLTATDAIRGAILRQAGHMELAEQASTEGLTTMKNDGVRKVLDGTTTALEVLRSVHTV